MQVLADSRDRDAWLNIRRSYGTASDSAALLGFDEHKSKLEVYAIKRGEMAEADAGEPAEIGLEMEPVLATLYQKRTGRRVMQCSKLITSAAFPRLATTLDAWVPAIWGPGELKATGRRSYDWDDGCPIYYRPQVNHQMLVTGARKASIGCLRGAMLEFVWQDIERDDEMCAAIVEAWADMWRRIDEQDPPMPDGSDSAGAALRALHPEPTPGKKVVLDHEVAIWTETLQRAQELDKQCKRAMKELRQKIELAIGDAEQGVLPGGGAWHWKSSDRKSYTVRARTVRTLSLGEETD